MDAFCHVSSGYAQTLPRNMNISNATYGNLVHGSPIKLSPTVQQQQQSYPIQVSEAQQKQTNRSVSPDLVSKRQLKDQMGQYFKIV